MLDLLLTRDHDLSISEWGDISLTNNKRQAIKIRLLWFFQEWRFAPDKGIPYFEEVFIKNPNILRVRRIIRDEVMSVEGVQDIKNIQINININTRVAQFVFDAVIDDEAFREEVSITWGNMD